MSNGIRNGAAPLRITGGCLKCGYCAQVCPMEAIRVKNRAFIIGAGCIDCQACLEICPVGAVVREED